jgi:hypothetical protein
MPAKSKTIIPTKLKALVLSEKELSASDRNVTQLLDFFGIPWETATIDQLGSGEIHPEDGDEDQCCLVSSAPVLAEAFNSLADSSDAVPWFVKKAGSAYVYGFQETASCMTLLKLLANDANAELRGLSVSPTLMSVTGDLPELCGPMSGLRVPIVPAGGDQAFSVQAENRALQSIISASDGVAFARVAWRGTHFYLNACRDTIDILATADEFFDVKKSFCSALPITMYLKWAFSEVCWKQLETGACLIVDDPLLKDRYGFLHFRHVLELMDAHEFTMSLAFIPWNWRRAHREVVRLFQERSDRFSLSVHGCDHTASEFAARSAAELNARSKIASRRMKMLQQRTALQHDRIMIFPQGEFSAEVGRVLKLNGFLAAVNTEVAPSRKEENRTRIADLWDVAINRYGSFPIFTRRYLTHGIENFAFDIFLGKPCLIVAHHDAFKDDARKLIGLIDWLNSLPRKLKWESLGNVVDHGVRVRVQSDGTRIVQMYGSCGVMDNCSEEPLTIRIMRHETDPDCVNAVTVNNDLVDWNWKDAYLWSTVMIPPQGVAEIRVLYLDKLGEGSYPRTVGYRIKTGLRRYLSETRDQFISQNNLLNKSVAWVRRFLK